LNDFRDLKSKVTPFLPMCYRFFWVYLQLFQLVIMRFLAKVTVTPPEKKIVFFNKNKTAIKNIKSFLFSSVTVTLGQNRI